MATTLQNIREKIETVARDSNDSVADATKNSLINEALRDISRDTKYLLMFDGYAHTQYSPIVDVSNTVLRLEKAFWRDSELVVEEATNDVEKQVLFGGSIGVPTHIFHVTSLDEWHLWPAPSAAVASSTLGAAISTTGIENVTVASLANFPTTSGVVLVDSEKLKYHTSDSTNVQLLGCSRGIGGTTAATHSNGATIKYLPLQLVYSYVHPTLSADGDAMHFPDDFLDLIVVRSMFLHYLRKRRDGNDRLALMWERRYRMELGRYAQRRINLAGRSIPGTSRVSDFRSHR